LPRKDRDGGEREGDERDTESHRGMLSAGRVTGPDAG
jgi:hypothetical protein